MCACRSPAAVGFVLVMVGLGGPRRVTQRRAASLLITKPILQLCHLLLTSAVRPFTSSPTWGRGTWATAAVSCRHRRRRSAYRRGLNAALYTSGYVECLRWVRGRVPQAYDFVPYMDLPDVHGP